MIVKDHAVSKQSFELIFDSALEMYTTSPQPNESELPSFYKSEDYISHTDSKRNLFEKTYHFVRKIALQRKLKLIESFNTSEKKLLDIGCGTGDFLKTAQVVNWNVFGIEPNNKARNIAIQKVGDAVFKPSRLATFQKHSFDVITLWHVLEHLPNLESQIAQLKTLLKPNGVLIIAVPNYNSFDAQYYKSFWAAYDVPRHLWHFSQTSIARLFSKVEMKVTQTHPMKFDAYYVSLLSEKIKTQNNNIIKAFYVGFISNLKAKRTKEYSSLIYCIQNM